MVKKITLWSIIMLSMMAMSSCNKDSKTTRLLEGVPENVDYVVFGDIKTVLESAGGSIKDDATIKLPLYIRDELPTSASNEFEELNTFLKKSGIDPDICAIVGNYKHSYPIYIFSISDKNKFTNAIEDEGFREKDGDNGLIVYSKKVYESYSGDYDDFSYIVIKDTYAYCVNNVWVGSDFKPVRAIERLIEDASETSYSKTSFCNYITSGNAAGASFRIPRELRKELRELGVSSSVLNQYEGVVCFKGTLDKDLMTIDLKWFSEDGSAKEIKDSKYFIDLKAKINRDALQYLGKDEALVFAMSLQNIDWNNSLELAAETYRLSRNDRATLSVVKEYLEKINGTIAFGIGLTNGLESIFNLMLDKNPLSQLAYTLVIDTKEGYANDLMDDLKGLMETLRIPYNGNSKGFSIEIPNEDIIIYAKAEDNHIILSNHVIRKSNDNVAVESLNFEHYTIAAAFSMNRNNALLKDLSINNDIQLTMATSENFESTLKLKVKGGNSEGIIAKVVKIILDIVSQEKSLESKWRNYRNETAGYNDYYDDDEVVVEEAVVVEEVPADSVEYAW